MQHDGDGERTLGLDDVFEGTSLDELHRNEQEAARLPFPVHWNDVGMIQRRCKPRLASEALGHLWVKGHLRRQHLQRDTAPESGFRRAIHHRHRAAAHLAIDVVLARQRMTHLGEQRVVRGAEEKRRGPRIDDLASAARTEARPRGESCAAARTLGHCAVTVKVTARRLLPLPYAASTVVGPGDPPNVICTSARPLALETRSTDPDPSTLPFPLAMRNLTDTP